jgi:hypothetical protein
MHSSFVRKPAALAAAAALLVSVFVPLAARADANAPAAASTAGVGVARISYIRGSVAVQRGDSATASTAVINAPVLGADYVTTGEDARAEIEFDGTTAVRLGAGVQMRFVHLDAGERELQLAEGTIELRLLREGGGRSQIDTPSVSVRPRTAGAYRVAVDADGRTTIAVRSGSADVITPQETRTVSDGMTLLAQGPAANPVLRYANAIGYDDFDTFNTSRDQRALRALADANYVAPGVSGVADLATYGRWVNDTSYGHVWVPSYVGSNWAPYRDGRWAWEDNYGWTWIGYEPWGWAPYHYGRWYHHRQYGWCWYPDPFVTAWRPALVGFFTFGSGVGLGFGNIGWVPLAPLDPFNPWWGYGNRTTIVNVTNNYYYANGNAYNNGSVYPIGGITKIYGNAKYNGVTYVPRHDFERGRFEHRDFAPAHLRDVQIVRGAVPIVPTSENLRYSDRPVAAQLAVHPAMAQQRFAGDATVVRRTPFEQQRAAIVTATRVPVFTQRVDPAPRRALTTTTAPETVNLAAPAPATAERRVNDPWTRFGTSRGAPAGARVTTSGVTVIDGARTTTTTTTATQTAPAPVNVAPRTAHDPQAWTRYESVRTNGGAVRTNEPPVRTTETVRTYAAPSRANETAPQTQTQAQPQRYTAPAQQAPPPQQRYVPPPQPAPQPQRYVPPPSRPTTTTNTTSGASHPHAEHSSPSHKT